MAVNEWKRVQKPHWLKTKLPQGDGYARVSRVVREHRLHTICSSGLCPNLGECWGNGTATFLILGDTCTRRCRFCAAPRGTPMPPQDNEPCRVAKSVGLMGLKYCVITSVTRDDLPDGGAAHWQKSISEVKRQNPNTMVEVLIPDFSGNTSLIDVVLAAEPNVVAHNVETVERLTPSVRSHASYWVSLSVIRHIASRGFKTKSGLMLGLGESADEVEAAMDHLLEAGCSILTLGQYLQPRSENLPVHAYITPNQFEVYRRVGLAKGFDRVVSGPLVRSSYHAG